MTENNFITLSREHRNCLPDIQECFKDTGLKVDSGFGRNSEGELPMQILIFLGGAVVGGVFYDLVKAGVKSFFNKFKDGRVTIRGKGNIIFSIKLDLTVNTIVVPDRQKEFEHIKEFDDMIEYIKKQIKKEK